MKRIEYPEGGIGAAWQGWREAIEDVKAEILAALREKWLLRRLWCKIVGHQPGEWTRYRWDSGWVPRYMRECARCGTYEFRPAGKNWWGEET